MRQLSVLVWKEWCEVRAFLWIGLGVFVGLPVIGGLEALAQSAHRFSISTAIWVLPFAGLLAIFVGVGAACRDFGGRLEEFWRAQPTGILKPLLVKFVVGLAVVMAACVPPLLLEWTVNLPKDRSVLQMARWFPFVWTALYSLGFAAGCLVRRTAQAAMLAVSAMLLLYFLPALLPPLAALSADAITDTVTGNRISGGAGLVQFRFAGGMLLIALASLVLAILAIRYHWHVVSGQRVMYGTVALTVLILFATASFSLGTNLPSRHQMDLPNNEWPALIHMDGEHGFLLSMSYNPFAANPREKSSPDWMYRSIELNGQDVTLGNPQSTAPGWQAMRYPSVAWDPHRQAVAYSATEWAENDKDICFLYREEYGTSDWRTSWRQPRKLWEYDCKADHAQGRWVSVLIWQNQLYVIGTRVAKLDLDSPGSSAPTVTTLPLPFSFASFGPANVEVRLPVIPEIPARQRLQATLNQMECRLEGDVLCVSATSQLLKYRLTNLTDTTATFDLEAHYEETILERAFGSFDYSNLELRNGLLYVSNVPTGGYLNPHVTVFDVRPGHPFRPIGHFAAPGSSMLACPLPGGRALVAGSKLWLVGPPPLTEGDQRGRSPDP